MFLEIAEVSRHESGHVYVLVNFWATRARHDANPANPDLSNDFLIQITRRIVRIVTDASGNLKRVDGVFVAPDAITDADEAIGWTRETVFKTNLALRQEVRDHLLAYWRRAKLAILAGKAYPRKHDQRERLLRNLTDSDGVLARVRALEGTTQEVAGE